MSYTPSPIRFIPGINPEPDETKQNTRRIVDGNHVRFFRDGAEKFGGHLKEPVSTTPSGYTRTLFSYIKSNKKWQIIGTHSKLYAKLGSTVTNITPLKTAATTTLGTDPVRTRYDDIQTNPLETFSGSTFVNIYTFLYDEVVTGDLITISGITGSGGTLNGIPLAEINTTHIVDNQGTYLRIRTSTAATSSGLPTEAGSVITIKALKITYTAHGLSAGDRIKLSGATGPVGGVPASEINKEHVISVIETANTFIVPCTTAATSLASGGGSAVDIFKEIDAGNISVTSATGPGIGVPGLGLPGSIQTDTSLVTQPRIWWIDVIGTTMVCGPGQGGKCYQWLGDTATAPTIITNAPTADIGWVEGAKLVVFDGNTLSNSDVGDLTDWTAAADSSAYTDDKEDMNQVTARSFANGENLIYADENKIFRLRWVGGAVKWLWERINYTVGIVGPHGAITAPDGNTYIFGEDNLYAWNGASLAPIQGNTLYKYLFENINKEQRYKFFTWFNPRYNEIGFRYASSTSSECDREVVYSITEGHFTKREDITRSAADRSGQVFDYPILAHPTNGTYQHEIGHDDDTSAMEAWAQIANEAISNGKVETFISGMEPDLTQTGTMTVELYGKDRAKDDDVLFDTFTLTEENNVIECEHEMRWRGWIFRSNTLGGYFRLGGMREFVQPGGEF